MKNIFNTLTRICVRQKVALLVFLYWCYVFEIYFGCCNCSLYLKISLWVVLWLAKSEILLNYFADLNAGSWSLSETLKWAACPFPLFLFVFGLFPPSLLRCISLVRLHIFCQFDCAFVYFCFIYSATKSHYSRFRAWSRSWTWTNFVWSPHEDGKKKLNQAYSWVSIHSFYSWIFIT